MPFVPSGVASLIFWALTILVLFKYVLVVLSADHEGEGGTFALYALLCHYLGITAGKPKVGAASDSGRLARSDKSKKADSNELSGFDTAGGAQAIGQSEAGVRAPLGAPHEERDHHMNGWDRVPKPLHAFRTPQIAAYLRKAFRSSLVAQVALMIITLLSSGMLIGDGIITPSISVLSAVGGLANIPGVRE